MRRYSDKGKHCRLLILRMSVRLRLAAPLLPLLPLFQTAPACRGKRTLKNHIAFLHSLQSIMVLPDVNDYKEMDCAGTCAFSRLDTNLRYPKLGGSPELVEKRNNLTGESYLKTQDDPQDDASKGNLSGPKRHIRI